MPTFPPPAARSARRLQYVSSLLCVVALLGACADGPLPTSPVLSGPSPLLVTTPIGFAQVDAGGLHTCSVTTAGAVACWGANESMQSTVPAEALTGMAQVSAGGDHSCAVSVAGAVLCWGADGSGQSTVPVNYQAGGVARVSAGALHTCVVTTTGNADCWGSAADGRTAVSGDLTPGAIHQISAGEAHSCFIANTSDYRSMRCWGLNTSGQTTYQYPDSGIAQVTTGAAHTCILNKPRPSDAEGHIRCRGDDSYNQRIEYGDWIWGSDVSAGAYHTCVVSLQGGVSCFGRNSSGESTVPADIPVGIKQVSAGNTHTCAVSTAGAVACWGANDKGQTTVPNLNPTTTDLITDLRAAVGGSTLTPDIRRALTAKLDDALKALAAGKKKPTCSALADFTRQVLAQRGRAIAIATADLWLEQVAEIRTSAGC